MDVIVSTGAFPGYQLPNIFQTVKNAGADGIELLLSSRLVEVPAAYFRDLQRSHDLPIRSVHTVLRLRRADIATARQDILRSARLAASLGCCSVLVVHTPEVNSLHDASARAWFSGIEEATDIVKSASVRIAIENSGKLSPSSSAGLFDHAYRLRSMAQEWDLGITFDTAHAGSRNWDLLDSARLLYPRIANVHLSDFGGRTSRFSLVNSLARDHRLPGQGTLPLDDLIALLARQAYSGLVTLELSPLRVRAWWRPAAERLIREAVERCRVEARELHPYPRSQRPQQRT